MNDIDRMKMEVNTEHEMDLLLKRAKQLAGNRDVSMLRLREWVLGRRQTFPENEAQRIKLEFALESNIEKVIKRHEYE